MGLKSGSSTEDMYSDDDAESESKTAEGEPDNTSVRSERARSSGRSFLMRRKMNDGKVSDFERPETITAPVREFVVDDERELQAEFDSQLVQKLQLTDLHEAAFMAALENPDLVFAKLIEMGYEAEE